MIAIAAIICGLIFGAILYKVNMINYDFQVSAMRLRGFGMFKFYMAAQLSAWICIMVLMHFGLHPNTQSIFRPINAIIGGLIFGVGWGALGYCPGTCAVAAAMGKFDGIIGFIGIIFGVFLGLNISDLFNKYFHANKLIIININESTFFKMTFLLTMIYFVTFIIFDKTENIK